MNRQNFLIGNTFPLSLIRRDVNIRCELVENIRTTLAFANLYSFWGHVETMAAAETFLGVSLRPAEVRPVISLTPDGFPVLYGKVFMHCFVCSPDCRPGYRHALGQTLSVDDILGWQLLRLDWTTQRKEG